MSWARFLIPVLLVMSVVAAYLTRGPTVKRSHGSCLVHDGCPASERCLVVPAADGFVSAGQCVDPCEGDLQCPAGFRCEAFGEARGHWTADRSKGTGGAANGCVPGARRDEAADAG